MRKSVLTVGVLGFFLLAAGAYAVSDVLHAKPDEFDPSKTRLVQATWLEGIGCPTEATIAPFGEDETTYTDPACPTGDDRDGKVEGLLLAKTGPTNNNASAIAEFKNVKGLTLTELGYDIRKPGVSADPRGSHCGAGAPRFNVMTDEAGYFIGCNSPPAPVQEPGAGWLRLRWGRLDAAARLQHADRRSRTGRRRGRAHHDRLRRGPGRRAGQLRRRRAGQHRRERSGRRPRRRRRKLAPRRSKGGGRSPAASSLSRRLGPLPRPARRAPPEPRRGAQPAPGRASRRRTPARARGRSRPSARPRRARRRCP